MADTRHWIVVEPDTAYIEQYGDDPDDPAIKWRIECSDPAACPGWMECPENHAGYDPNVEESPAFDQYEDVMIHGVAHEWRTDYGWTVPFDGCPVQDGGDDASDIAHEKGVGRWEVDDDWDDTTCYLTVIEPEEEAMTADELTATLTQALDEHADWYPRSVVGDLAPTVAALIEAAEKRAHQCPECLKEKP